MYNVILILLLADLVWKLGQINASLAIQPTIHTIRLTLDMASVYPSHHLLASKIVPKYNLKAIITFYGEYYICNLCQHKRWLDALRWLPNAPSTELESREGKHDQRPSIANVLGIHESMSWQTCNTHAFHGSSLCFASFTFLLSIQTNSYRSFPIFYRLTNPRRPLQAINQKEGSFLSLAF
jgi:hypothetical protein